MVYYPEVGSKIGNYTLLQPLGDGATGLVFKAVNNVTHTECVMKIIFLKNAFFRREYEQEVNSLKIVRGYNIVKMLDHFIYKTMGVVVLELLAMDLLDCTENQKLSTDNIKTIFLQICHAVKYIHSYNIAHLDIKPENIFMNDINSIKLGDFGSAFKWSKENPYKIGKTGTTFYSAPEVKANGSSYSPAECDIWSLGVLLHVLCTGYWPYSANSEQELRRKVNTGETRIIIDKLPQDEDLINLISDMLEYNPNDRPSIDEILSSTWLKDVDFEISIQPISESSSEERIPLFKPASSAPELTELPIIKIPSSFESERSKNGSKMYKTSPIDKRRLKSRKKQILSRISKIIKI